MATRFDGDDFESPEGEVATVWERMTEGQPKATRAPREPKPRVAPCVYALKFVTCTDKRELERKGIDSRACKVVIEALGRVFGLTRLEALDLLLEYLGMSHMMEPQCMTIIVSTAQIGAIMLDSGLLYDPDCNPVFSVIEVKRAERARDFSRRRITHY